MILANAYESGVLDEFYDDQLFLNRYIGMDLTSRDIGDILLERIEKWKQIESMRP